jgi:hypothetical protein
MKEDKLCGIYSLRCDDNQYIVTKSFARSWNKVTFGDLGVEEDIEMRIKSYIA